MMFNSFLLGYIHCMGGFIVTITSSLLLCIRSPLPSTPNLFPAPLETIARVFFVLFHKWSHQPYTHNLNHLHSSFLPHKYPHTHTIPILQSCIWYFQQLWYIWVWFHIPVFPAFGRLRQEVGEFKVTPT
jgi:hypothetical protein